MIIRADDVTMTFRMANDRINSFKEFFIKKITNKLKYKEFTALQNVSFSIEKGEVFGIIGSNGAGKSTLLKLISGILAPTSGNITVNGSIAPMLELGAGFDVDLTARENVFLNGAVLGYSKKYLLDRYDDIVKFAELEEFMDTPIRNFSSGMTMRLAFSIATLVNPDVLIVDEILSVGDEHFQQKSLQRMKELMSGGTTVLLVSHSLEQIRKMCTRVLWLDHGKVQMIGETDDVCDAYMRFMGKVPPKRNKTDRLHWSERLYSPTDIKKYGNLYFIVDCWHHRVLYNQNIKDPIKNWKTLNDELQNPQSVTSDGEYFLVEDTANNLVKCFQQTEKGFVCVQVITGIGKNPHKIVYDEKSKRFFGVSSQSGQVFALKRVGEKFQVEKVFTVESFVNSYVRSLSLIDGQIYCVSGPAEITVMTYENKDFKIVKTFKVPFELQGMNDIAKFGSYYYISVYQDGSLAIKPKLVRVKNLEDLINGDYEDLYNALNLEGVPYYFSFIDGRVFLTEIDTFSAILSFEIENDVIQNMQMHYSFGAPNGSSKERRKRLLNE
jgi:ABC-type polysaccharide/polyol phosphate transport system ATPase subunit